MIGFIIVVAIALFSVYLLKIQKKIMPQHYFYYGQIFENPDTDISAPGLIFRTAIPFFAGLLTGILTIIAHCPKNPEVYGLSVGFVITFLVIWPSIYYPESVVEFKNKKKSLYLLRIMFVSLFCLLGLVGGKFSVLFFQFLQWSTKKQIYAWIDPKAIINNLVSTFIYAMLAVIVICFRRKYLKSITTKTQ